MCVYEVVVNTFMLHYPLKILGCKLNTADILLHQFVFYLFTVIIVLHVYDYYS